MKRFDIESFIKSLDKLSKDELYVVEQIVYYKINKRIVEKKIENIISKFKQGKIPDHRDRIINNGGSTPPQKKRFVVSTLDPLKFDFNGVPRPVKHGTDWNDFLKEIGKVIDEMPDLFQALKDDDVNKLFDVVSKEKKKREDEG